MSSFYKLTKHPKTGEFEKATWDDRSTDGYYVIFPSDGSEYPESSHKWETKDDEPPFKIGEEATLSMTYKELAIKFYENQTVETLEATSHDPFNLLLMFAANLDSQNVLTHQLELLAIMQARKIDREFMQLLIDEVGLPKAKEIALKVNQKHRKVSCQGAQNQSGDKNSESEQSEKQK